MSCYKTTDCCIGDECMTAHWINKTSVMLEEEETLAEGIFPTWQLIFDLYS